MGFCKNEEYTVETSAQKMLMKLITNIYNNRGEDFYSIVNDIVKNIETTNS